LTEVTDALDTKIETIQAGTNITVDDTDPLNPIVSATGGSQDLQGVLDTGNYAESPSTFSYAEVNLDDTTHKI